VHLKQVNRKWATYKEGDRRCNCEPSQYPSTVLGREPEGEEEDYSREEAGLGNTQEETNNVETIGADNECRGCCGKSPGDHDSSHPEPCAEPVHGQITGDFAKAITHEHYPCTQAKLSSSQPELVGHLQGCVTDTCAIQVVEEIGQCQQWDKPPSGLLHCSLLHQRCDFRLRHGQVGIRGRDISHDCILGFVVMNTVAGWAIGEHRLLVHPVPVALLISPESHFELDVKRVSLASPGRRLASVVIRQF